MGWVIPLAQSPAFIQNLTGSQAFSFCFLIYVQEPERNGSPERSSGLLSTTQQAAAESGFELVGRQGTQDSPGQLGTETWMAAP